MGTATNIYLRKRRLFPADKAKKYNLGLQPCTALCILLPSNKKESGRQGRKRGYPVLLKKKKKKKRGLVRGATKTAYHRNFQAE